MKLRNIVSAIAVLLIFAIVSTAVFAANNIDVRYVKVNGDELDVSNTERIDLTEELDIQVRLEALDNVSDIEVAARITGYKYSDKDKLVTYDVVNVDDLDEGDLETISLKLDVPKDMDQQDYGLLVEIYDNNGRVAEYKAALNVQGEDNYVDIVRVSFDPAEVVAGRALRTRVRLENLGEEDEDDLYVKVAIPALGANMYTTADVDELDEGDLTTTEDLLLRIPECVEAGYYDVVVSVEYDNGHETTETTEEIRILESDACEAAAAVAQSTDRTIITPPMSQEITAGDAGVSFPLIIKNDGSEDKTYIVSVSGVEGWGSADVSTPAPYVRAGQSEVVYVYLDANSGVSGQKTFVVSVSDGKDTKNLPVVVSIAAGEESIDTGADWKQWLYAGIIVLLVLIVILGLAIGFKKASSDDDEEYY